MTQTFAPAASAAWLQALQLKLMVALDAAWALIERGDDPAVLRRARDRAKAIGDLAAVARKVGLIVPAARKGLTATKSVADLTALVADTASVPMAVPATSQAEHSRRALDRLKSGGRGRL